MNFSMRYQFSPLPPASNLSPIAHDFLNKELRTGLWNIFLSRVFSFVVCTREGMVSQDFHVFISLWKHFYKLPLDDYERDVAERKAWYRDQFEAVEWFKLLDMVEFVVQKLGKDAGPFLDEVNALFEQHSAPYRLTRGAFIPAQSTFNTEAMIVAGRLLESHELASIAHDFHAALSFFADSKKQSGASATELWTQAVRTASTALANLCAALDFEKLTLSATSQALVRQHIGINVTAHITVFETEFLLTSIAVAMRLVLDSAVTSGRLSASQHTLLKNASLNIWGELG